MRERAAEEGMRTATTLTVSASPSVRLLVVRTLVMVDLATVPMMVTLAVVMLMLIVDVACAMDVAMSMLAKATAVLRPVDVSPPLLTSLPPLDIVRARRGTREDWHVYRLPGCRTRGDRGVVVTRARMRRRLR